MESQKILLQDSVLLLEIIKFLLHARREHLLVFFHRCRVINGARQLAIVIEDSLGDLQAVGGVRSSRVYSHLPCQLILQLGQLHLGLFEVELGFDQLLLHLRLVGCLVSHFRLLLVLQRPNFIILLLELILEAGIFALHLLDSCQIPLVAIRRRLSILLVLFELVLEAISEVKVLTTLLEQGLVRLDPHLHILFLR